MNFNGILNAMEKRAREIVQTNPEYQGVPDRGVLVVQLQNKENPAQWDGSMRVFGAAFSGPKIVDGLPINSGSSYDTTAYEKIAYCRRTGKDSGAAFYEVVGDEKPWKGAVISADKKCICAFSGYHGEEDVLIARAGITAYEGQK